MQTALAIFGVVIALAAIIGGVWWWLSGDLFEPLDSNFDEFSGPAPHAMSKYYIDNNGIIRER